jgi:hypothetical protein
MINSAGEGRGSGLRWDGHFKQTEDTGSSVTCWAIGDRGRALSSSQSLIGAFPTEPRSEVTGGITES